MSKPERELFPERSPLDQFGYQLRKCRRQRGMSQAQLGKLVHVSGALLHRVEVGERRPSRDLAERCDAVLGAEGALARAWDDIPVKPQREARTRDGADDAVAKADETNGEHGLTTPGADMILVSMLSLTGECVLAAVDRRAIVTGAIAVPVVGWLGRGVPQLSEKLPDGDLEDAVREMTSLRVILTRQDSVLGAGSAAPTVIHQLSILDRLSERARGAARESVRRCQAAYAEFAGWLADDLGDWRAGQYWTDRALEWAHEADDDLIVGYTLARKAQRALAFGDAAAALSLARAAQRRDGLTSRVRAAALQYEALGHASAGEAGDFQKSVDRARELVESAAPVGDGDWAAWCSPGYVTMHEAAGWTSLNEHARAVSAYERALAGWPSEFRREQGLYLGRLASAHARAGCPEEAAANGRRALDIAIDTGSARIFEEIKALLADFDSWRGVTSIRILTADLRQALVAREPRR